MSRDHHDALIEQLLRESLGGDRPRDLTPRVMALAKAFDRTCRSWWISAGAAVAASIAIAISLFLFWPGSYPAPVIEGPITLVNGGNDIQRGAQLATDNQGGTMTIGGYAKMTVGANTTFTLGGERKKEIVYLDQGHLGVTVAKKKWSFDVVVEEALVHVTGTQFDVDVWTVLNEELQTQKKMRVDVTEGSVEVSLKGGKKQLVTKGNPLEVTVSSAALQKPQIQAMIDPASPDGVVELQDDPDAVAGEGAGRATEAVTKRAEILPADPKVGNSINPTNPASPTRAGTGPPNVGRGGETGTADRGLNARGPLVRPRVNMPDPKLVPLLAVGGMETYEFNGLFQKFGTNYVLNTGRVLLLLGTGADDIPRGSPNPGPNSRVRVKFSKGKVVSIVALPATTRPGGRGQDSK